MVVKGIGRIAAAALAFAQSNTAKVTPANPQGWAFAIERTPGMSDGSFVNGPAGAPAATGSAALSTVGETGAHVLGTLRYANTKLSDIAVLEYHSIGNLTPAAIALQLDVDSGITDANTAYQERLVFEPYQSLGNAAVVPANGPNGTCCRGNGG